MKIGQEQQILVEVGEYRFCIDLDEVLSIINPPKMVRLPSTRGAFIRAFKYQDELGAAVSMRVKFGLSERENMQSGQILLGRLNGRLAGFWFDKVLQILKIGDGAEWFPVPAKVSLPTAEFDGFVRYREHLIPHTSLLGLLRFDQAEAWRKWLATEMPRLEAGVLEEEVAGEAPTQAPAESLPEEPQLTMEEFYALMDEAGVVDSAEFEVTEPPPPAVELPEEAAETPHVDGLQMAEMDFEEEFEKGEAAEQESPPLAVPVTPPEPEPEAPIHGLQVTTGTEEEVPVEEAPAEEARGSGEDAMFSLERKRDDIRKRMNPEGDANLGDYSIIKVGDKGLFRWLRRWLRRLFLVAFLAAIAYIAVMGTQYQQQQKLTLEQFWIHTPDGDTDWDATRKAVQKELGRFGRFLKRSLKVLQ
jgi:chemotaxis signal transduction protein